MSDTIGPDENGRAHILLGTAAGEITAHIDCEWEMREHQFIPPGATAILCERDTAGEAMAASSRWRILDGYVVAREEMHPEVSAPSFPADGSAECSISGLPDPCEVRITGAVEVAWTPVEGGSVILTATVPGRLQVSVRCPPAFRPWQVDLDAV